MNKLAWHRNGITGEPFYVAIKKSKHLKDPKRLVVIHFDESRTAVLDIDLLNKEVIEFGLNSFRGDHFTDEMVQAIEEHNEDISK